MIASGIGEIATSLCSSRRQEVCHCERQRGNLVSVKVLFELSTHLLACCVGFIKELIKAPVNLLERIADLIFPPRCIFCNTFMDPGAELHICGTCHKSIPFAGGNAAGISGISALNGCDAAISVCRYEGIVKDSLIRYKFYNKPGYYRAFSKLLTAYVFKVTNSIKFDMIISIPLHKNKEFKRGYNQALLISRALSRETGIKECSGLLVRTRNTNAQSLLDRKSRLINVKDAFRVTEPGKIKGKSILLIDDILTTGTTVNECGRTLKEAGAKEVIAAVIATGQKV